MFVSPYIQLYRDASYLDLHNMSYEKNQLEQENTKTNRSTNNNTNSVNQKFRLQNGLTSSDMGEFKMYADWEHSDDTWYEKYGDRVPQIYYIDQETGIFKRVKMNGLFRFEPRDITPTKAFRKPLTPDTTYYPMEALDTHIVSAVDNFNKFGNTGEYGDLKITRTDTAHDGFTKFWTIMSDRKHSVNVNDDLQFGINIRNGIGTQVALGVDLFSYRLVCSNGAVARDKKFGSVQIYHKGNASEIEEKFVDAMTTVLEKAGKLLDYYKTMREITMTTKLLDYIVETSEIPLRYLPEKIVDVVTPRDDKELSETIIKLRDRNATLFDFFQGITNPLSRAVKLSQGEQGTATRQKLGFHGFTKHTTKLHQVVIKAIDSPRVYA